MKRSISMTIITLGICTILYSCNSNPSEPLQQSIMSSTESSQDEVYEEVDVLPEPPGGFKEFYSWIGSNLKYPDEARKNGIEGKVNVQFIVGKDGKLRDIKVLRGIGKQCDAESLRVINNSADWKPGIKEGKKVNVKLVLPITFKLS